MKGKTALTLMEQAIMLLILALAAALCLQAFAWADTQSRQNSSRDQALTQLQNAAELLKAHSGDLSAASASYGGHAQDGQWLVFWDENWIQTPSADTYRLHASLQNSHIPNLGSAVLTLQQNNTELCSLTVCWQEVAP